MNPKSPIPILFLAIFFLPCRSSDGGGGGGGCNQTCGGRTLPFPFGFSAACHIRLNCSSDAAVLAAGFPVQSISGDTVLINLPPICGRPVEELRRLFTQNYAPTSRNAVLLQNCTRRPAACFIPTTDVRTTFQLNDCGGRRNDSISCYSEPAINRTGFIDYENLTRTGCRSLFSAISTEDFPAGSPPSVSLDVQMMRIEWWLLGDCRCSQNARCVNVTTSLEGNPAAYRCRCREGFAGDGYSGGLGCRRNETQRCSRPKFISLHCGRTAKIILIAGGVATITLLIAFFTHLFFLFRSQLKLRKGAKKLKKLRDAAGISIPVYSYKQMAEATGNFSDEKRLGTGGYGTVYSGKLDRDEWVAIKKIKRRDFSTIQQVVNEIKLISTVHHPNLVRLLGCCIDADEQILVYEFMPNGTLLQHLQRERGDGLPWQVRLEIAVETARAVSYLHDDAVRPPIYHRDIKSGNILLDYNFKSKVADFGLSRAGRIDGSHVSTAPQGTPGYGDPQYHQHFQLSDKSDVYSFGVVLAEIVTGMRAVDFGRAGTDVNLAAMVVDRIGTGRLDEIVDPYIVGPPDGGDHVRTMKAVGKVAELAFRCLAFAREMRPSMAEVANELEQIGMSRWDDGESETTSYSSSPSLADGLH
ncbi:wall-associated receptor kinase-like 14 [Andrographis paniculata]|uniref:wall-associated receptor kinase-like 14 n=1 Tax=Andrographis paniculata TaxID=175694 RepID=UPI0021E92A97|nr:wall-associated receptor kinase-like 14 [Andrographis paniculata]